MAEGESERENNGGERDKKPGKGGKAGCGLARCPETAKREATAENPKQTTTTTTTQRPPPHLCKKEKKERQ